MKFAYGPETAPLPGFTIKRAIDRGGFGEVYYGLADSGKEVALKLLQRNQQVELRGVRQCLNLKHPNLVAIYDIRTDREGDDWVIMEYVAGRSLDVVLAENPDGLPLPEVEHWLRGIAAGVAFLHDRGIVHRDLKPGNVFSENGVVKVGDVGLSKFMTPSRRSAQTESVGTVYYMAPEVARGRYGCELDVYSLGVMLYEMISGKLPFDGESVAEILMKHLTEHPDLDRIPARFRPVVARALEKDPGKRTPGVLRLAEEFQAALDGAPQPAIEIPESHFVDVVRLEVQQGKIHRKPPRPIPTDGGAVQPNRSVAVAGSAVPGFWDGLGHELKTNPVLIVAILVTCTFVVPVMAYGVAGAWMAWPAFLTWFAVGSTAFWVNRKRRLASESRSFRRGRPRPPSPPRRSTKLPRGSAVEAWTAPVGESQVAARQESTDAPPVMASAGTNSIRRGGSKWNTVWRNRTRRLASSLTLAVVWSILLWALITLFQNHVVQTSITKSITVDSAHGALFTLTTILGSWAILVPVSLSNGLADGSPARRFVQFPLAVLVGLCAGWLNEILMVRLPAETVFPGLLKEFLGWKLSAPDAMIPLAAYVAFFTLLLGVRRWGSPSDPSRSRRFSLWTVAGAALVAWLLPLLFRFNQSWGACWAAAISAVVQLSSPWAHPVDRNELAHPAPPQTLAV